MTEEIAKRASELYDLKSKYHEMLSSVLNCRLFRRIEYSKMSGDFIISAYPSYIHNLDLINNELKEFLIQTFEKKLKEIDLEIQNLKC